MLTELLAVIALATGSAAKATTHHSAVRALPPTVTVHAKEFSYAGPKSIKSGATIFRLVNEGKEIHHLIIVKLDKGKTMADFAASMKNRGPPPAWVTFEGGPNPALPGASAEAILSLDAGNYVMMCVVPSPGENAPHAAKGMVGPLTVLPARTGASEHAPTETITPHDFAFVAPATLSAGHHTLNVVNDGPQPPALTVLPLGPGKTLAAVGELGG